MTIPTRLLFAAAGPSRQAVSHRMLEDTLTLAKPMPRIMPIPAGWDPMPGEPFYPDDLPDDWRLAYFATQFSGVLVPGELWLDAESAIFRSWAEDTPNTFRFFLELRGGAPARTEPAAIGTALGARLGGLVGEPGVLRRYPGCDYALYQRVVPGSWLCADRGQGLAIDVPAGLIGDLRAARAWLEGIADAAGRPALALTGRAGFDVLDQWQRLARLLGFA